MARQILIGPDTKIARAGGRPPPAVTALLVEQIGLFLVWAFADGPPWFAEHLAASAGQTLGRLEIWQPLTALLVHLSSRSLILNMLSLWIFGSALERWWGTRRFLLFWLTTGVLGLVAGVLVGQLQPEVVLAGSAGAAAAMIVVFGLIFPEHLVFFYGLLPLKAKHLTLIFLAFLLLSSLLGANYLEAAVQLTGVGIALLFLRKQSAKPSGRPRGKKQGNGKARGKGKLKVLPGGREHEDQDKKRLWN